MICGACSVSMAAHKQRRRRRQSMLQEEKQRKMTEKQASEDTRKGVIREGFMKKRGVWSRALKKRYFVLFATRQMHYYGEFKDGIASDERGVADLSKIEGVNKQKETGLEVVTALREWRFECESKRERDVWCGVFESLMAQS